MRQRGIFIVMEGADGSGKTTQFNLLTERLKAIGYDVAVFDFPRYDKGSSHFVKQYLNGAYGNAADVSPYTASLFFALDRYEAAKDIEQALSEGKIVLSNRYTGSNMAHQGGKFVDEVEQRGFFVWADNLEFQLLGIPRPDTNIFLRVPAEVSYELIKRKQSRSYTDKVHDEHEADMNHLKKSVATYDLLCQLFPKDFQAIECTKKGRLLGVAEINNLIWERLKPILPTERPHPSRSVVVSLGETAGQINNQQTASGGDLSFPFQKSSLLLRLQMERYLPGSTGGKFVSWHQSDYEFYSPRGLPKAAADEYKRIFKEMAVRQVQLRERLLRHLEKHLLTNQTDEKLPLDERLVPLVPLGALSPFRLSLRKLDVVPLCGYLLSQDTAEAQWAANQLYLAARQHWPKEFKNSMESSIAPESITQMFASFVSSELPRHSSDGGEIKLLAASPRREFDLLAESIYPFSNLSLTEIADEVAEWPFQQKLQSLRQIIDIPGLLDKVSYQLDLVTDQVVINELTAAASLKAVSVQPLTPRYGYDIPSVIDEAGLSDLYDDCFDSSLKLYSALQAADQSEKSEYATLMGHKARWQLRASAAQLRSIIGLKGKADLEQACAGIYEKISEAHPLLWEIIAAEAAPAMKSRPAPKPRVKESHRRPDSKPKKS